MDFICERKMGYLLLRKLGSNVLRLHFGFSIFIDTDCNKRGQTSRLVARAQIQTSCNLKRTYITVISFWILSIFGASSIFWNRFVTSYYQYVHLALCFVVTIFAYTKIFFTLRHNQIHVQNHVAQGQPSQAIPLNIARYRKAVYSALWVQGTLVICYLPYVIVVALQPQRGMSLSIYRAQQFTTTLVHLNSSLNPLLYCWKIREVRQAVKETLRQLFCGPS